MLVGGARIGTPALTKGRRVSRGDSAHCHLLPESRADSIYFVLGAPLDVVLGVQADFSKTAGWLCHP